MKIGWSVQISTRLRSHLGESFHRPKEQDMLQRCIESESYCTFLTVVTSSHLTDIFSPKGGSKQMYDLDTYNWPGLFRCFDDGHRHSTRHQSQTDARMLIASHEVLNIRSMISSPSGKPNFDLQTRRRTSFSSGSSGSPRFESGDFLLAASAVWLSVTSFILWRGKGYSLECQFLPSCQILDWRERWPWVTSHFACC